MDLQHGESSSTFRIKPGSVIAGRYEVVAQIAAGGMGIVFQCRDRALNNDTIALKLLNPYLAQDDKVFQRFLNEVLVARSLSHPNIVRIHDIGRTEDGYPYISMEYLDGRSLRDRLDALQKEFSEGKRQTPALDFNEAVNTLLEILKGAAVAHQKGIIHRDFKPGNILTGSNGEIKIVDFGTARIVGGTSRLTQDGSMMGTPDYMSPEQIAGEPLDVTCDIYALGIMGYEFVVGETPFGGENLVAIAFKHVNEAIPRFASEERGIPKWYEEIIVRACAKSKYDRFSSAEEFALALMEQTAYPSGDFRALGLATASGAWPTMTNLATATHLQAVGYTASEARNPTVAAESSKAWSDGEDFTSAVIAPPEVKIGASQKLNWMWTSIGVLGVLLVLGLVTFNRPEAKNDEGILVKEKTREQLERELKDAVQNSAAETPKVEEVVREEVKAQGSIDAQPKQDTVQITTPEIEQKALIKETAKPEQEEVQKGEKVKIKEEPKAKQVVAKLEPKVSEPKINGPVDRYAGSLSPSTGGGEAREMNISLSMDGDNLTGVAEVKGLGKLVVEGTSGARGLILNLYNSTTSLRLTGSRRGSVLRGRYLVQGTDEEGSWQVSPLN